MARHIHTKIAPLAPEYAQGVLTEYNPFKKRIRMNYWTTADGEQKEYKDLSDDHLRNIIDDGYRSEFLKEEAERRKFDYPLRLVDMASLREMCIWLESFASTAISGNETGVKMMTLYNTDRALYLIHLNLMMEKNAIDVIEKVSYEFQTEEERNENSKE